MLVRLMFIAIILTQSTWLVNEADAQLDDEPASQTASPTLVESAPGWSEYQSLVQRLEAVEAENAQLKAQDAELRSLLDPNLNPIEQASYSTSLMPATDPLCSSCGETDCDGCGWTDGFGLSGKRIVWDKAGGWEITPFGQLRGEAIYSTAAQTADAVILLLNPRNPGVEEDQATVHGKTSQINFAVKGPTYGDVQTGGLVLINFLGPQPLRNQSGANIVNAYGEIKNDDWRLAFGRMFDLFGPIAPTTVNGLNQRGAGNIGIFRGAMHLDRFINVSDEHRWTLSTRISQANILDYAIIPEIRGKDNGWPNIEARIGVELGPQEAYGQPFEVGVSGVVGELQAVADSAFGEDIVLPALDDVVQTRGLALDAQLKGENIGVRGELWWGQAAGTYFVATLQSINPETNQAIESVGGWGEVYLKVCPNVTLHLGYGIDDPLNNDLGFLDRDNVGIGQVSFNEVAWGNAIWNATDSIEFALEVSERRTKYLNNASANSGTLFHFASTIKF